MSADERPTVNDAAAPDSELGDLTARQAPNWQATPDERYPLDETFGVDFALGFQAWAVTVENPTSRYCYVPSAGLYVPPRTFSRTVQLPGVRRGRVIWEPPPSVAQPAAIPGERAFVIFYDRRPLLVIAPLIESAAGSAPVCECALTNAELRAAPVPVSGPLTLAELTAGGTVVQTTLLTSPLDVQQSGGIPWGVTDAGGSLTVDPSPGTTWDVSDRAGRLLGIIASIASTVTVDVTDRAGRLLGQVSAAAGALWDVSDRAGRLLGVVASITNPVDVSDRAGRLLGVVASVTARITANIDQIGAAALTLGQKTMANAIPVVIASDQSTINVAQAASSVLFRGATASFRTPGRAGTAGQKVLAIYNAGGSGVVVTVDRVWVDLAVTVVKAVTVLPPNLKIWKFTAAPTNGTALTKNKVGGSSTSSASVTVTGDASADGTGSGTTLTVTLPAGTFIRHTYAARLITAAGYEPFDREVFDFEFGVQLAAGEGLCVFLDYVLATQNPTTDMWLAGVEWSES